MSNEKISIEIPAPPRSWVREGDYWLAPIEWAHEWYVWPVVSDGAEDNCNGAAEVGRLFVKEAYRCVGFLRMDELGRHKRTAHTNPHFDLEPLEDCTHPYPCLLDWQATHAVMKKEGEWQR